MMRRIVGLALSMLVVGGVLAPGVAAGGGCQPASMTETRTSDENTAWLVKCAFEPHVTYIEPGERVTWVNKDHVPHTVTGANMVWGDETYLEQGDKISFTFKEEGVFPYYCALHPGMVAAVVVGDGGTPGIGAERGSFDKVDLSAAGSTPPETKDEGLSTGSVVGIGALLVAFVVSIAYAQRSRKRALETESPATP
jgi:plastocyanin